MADSSDDLSQNPAVESEAVSKRRETVTIAVLLIVQFWIGSSSYLPMPFLTFEGKKRGLNELQVGIIIGAHELSRLITAPLCDWIMTKLRPKRSLVLGCLLCGLSGICFGLAGYTRGWTMFILCILFNIFSGASAALANVATSSIVMKSKSYSTTKLFGWLDMAIVLGLVGGFVIGGLLYKILKYVMTLVTVGILLVILTIPIWLLAPDITDDSKQEGFLHMLKIPGVTMLFLCPAIAEMGLVSTDTMLSEWVINLYEIAVDNVSFVYISWPILYALTTPIAVWTTEKGWKYSPVIISFLWLSVSYFVLCPSPILQQILPTTYKNPIWMIIVLLGTMGVAVSFIYIAIFQIALESATQNGYDGDSLHTFAKLSGVFYSGLSCGSVCGPPLSGIITQTLSYPLNETIITFLTTVMLAVFVVYTCRQHTAIKNMKRIIMKSSCCLDETIESHRLEEDFQGQQS